MVCGGLSFIRRNFSPICGGESALESYNSARFSDSSKTEEGVEAGDVWRIPDIPKRLGKQITDFQLELVTAVVQMRLKEKDN